MSTIYKGQWRVKTWEPGKWKTAVDGADKTAVGERLTDEIAQHRRKWEYGSCASSFFDSVEYRIAEFEETLKGEERIDCRAMIALTERKRS